MIGKSNVCTVPVKLIKSDCNSESTAIFQNWIMKNSSNLNISCQVVFSLNKWNKKVGSPSSFGRKLPFISLNSLGFIETFSYQVPNVRALVRALITQKIMRIKDAQCNWMELPSAKASTEQGHPTVRFGKYLFARPKLLEIFGFNCSEN